MLVIVITITMALILQMITFYRLLKKHAELKDAEYRAIKWKNRARLVYTVGEKMSKELGKSNADYCISKLMSEIDIKIDEVKKQEQVFIKVDGKEINAKELVKKLKKVEDGERNKFL